MHDVTVPGTPAGKQGWPWGETPEPLPLSLKSGNPWPRITVVTPSYNQGQFLEQTIRSVLMQGYPSLQFVIIDGGSSDESVSIIEKYESCIDFWVSERDRGQSHAINKGFERSDGEILCWLNSDDYFAEGTLAIVAETLARETGNYAMVGHAVRIDMRDGSEALFPGLFVSRHQLLRFWKNYAMPQSSIFWRREVYEQVGSLREDLHLIMDFDYWVRISEQFDFVNVDRVLSYVNFHDQAKTSDDYRSYAADQKNYALSMLTPPRSFGRLVMGMTIDLERKWNSLARRIRSVKPSSQRHQP